MNINISKLKLLLEGELPSEKAHSQIATPERLAMQRNPPPNVRKAGVLILLNEREGKLEFPLIKRPVYNGVHSGQMALPGGRIEEQDMNLVETAIRETKEEIGVEVQPIHILGTLSNLYIPPSNSLVTPVVAYKEKVSSYIAEEREVASIITVTMEELLDDSNLSKQEIKVNDELVIKTPAYTLKNETVWGATAMILKEFVMVFQAIKR